MRGTRDKIIGAAVLATSLAFVYRQRAQTTPQAAPLKPSAPALAMNFLSDGEPWGEVTRPTPGDPEPIGQYAAGCVRGGRPIEADGEGYHLMRARRRRFYAQPELLSFLRELGALSRARQIGDLLVGDLGQPRGGPMRTGHKSHQIGLDADVWARLAPPGTGPLTDAEREGWYTYSLVAADGRRINKKNFTARHEALFRLAALHPSVARIFVNPHVKRHLCERYPGGADAGWLRRLRPWWGHDAHFHVRLQCPPRAPKCVAQAEMPAGSGCGEELASWFDADGAVKPPPPGPPHAAQVALPSECENVLKE